ncbi:MAG: glycosyltransferase family 87 protein [Pirellulaceae bacterium]
MSQILFHYQRPDPVTWVYLSSLLIIGLFFVFYRFWSLRNVDLILLLLLSPGLLMVHEGTKLRIAGETIVSASHKDDPAMSAELAARIEAATPDELLDMADATQPESDPEVVVAGVNVADVERWGFLWLLGVAGLICIRMMLDPILIRRPLLDPNLSTGGLTFIGIAMFIFLMANVITSTAETQAAQGPKPGPGYPLVNMLPAIPTTPDAEAIGDVPPVRFARLARALAIISQLSVLLGLVFIGQFHFKNIRAGVGAAALYLLLPYTAQTTGRVDHVLPAALLVWAIFCYRRPILSGIFIGLAAGLVYYPLFLLPLWISFYWQRGLRRFLYGVGGTIAFLAALLLLGDRDLVFDRVQQMFGLWLPVTEGLAGIWGAWNPIWRLPILVAFGVLSGFFAFWPGQKNLGTLMSCSAAVMAAAQFWHGYGGGLYVAWYLPLMLLTVFRPNLEDRIALKVIGNGRKRIGINELAAGNEAA